LAASRGVAFESNCHSFVSWPPRQFIAASVVRV
jgi:hypothetical protein